MSSNVREFFEAFDYATFGPEFQIALGPLKFLYQQPKRYEACRTTHAFADNYVNKALEYRRNLLSTKSDSSGHTDQLRSQILQAPMAAQETTAILLSNAFFPLSRHTLVQQRLPNEIIALGDSVLDVNTLRNIKYLSNMLNECLALAETTLPLSGGYDGDSPLYVPEGTMFDTSYYVLHRLQSTRGSDGEVFDPDRWDITKPGIWEFMPFGDGPRGCAG
ncbi:hypothetical protein N7G274_008939 [Stereocaulon virgatum]|uniref:Cytochrome P450 n=1 Tax=Stereocaulon virgatum TaxID=373712 RepID=A0ABR3ZYK1_9LECA